MVSIQEDQSGVAGVGSVRELLLACYLKVPREKTTVYSCDLTRLGKRMVIPCLFRAESRTTKSILVAVVSHRPVSRCESG